MKKRITVGIVFAAISCFMVASPASAAHCADMGGPGASDFGKYYVQTNNGLRGPDDWQAEQRLLRVRADVG